MQFANHFLAKSLNSHVDCSVSVACGSLKGVPEDFYYPYSCYRAKSFSYLSQYLHLVNQKKMIKNEQINILHGAALHEGGYQAINLSKKMDIPFVAQSHGSDVQLVPDAGYGALTFSENKTKIKSAIKFSRKIIAVSSINKKNIIDFGCEPDKIEVIHNGCQFDEIQNVPLKGMKERYGIKPDDFVLISVGSDRSVKRIELLLKN
jgi:glycosyltransferase involved in cell wall biosynthesis